MGRGASDRIRLVNDDGITPVNPATAERQDAIIAAIGAIPGGGGTQYTEDAVSAADPVGTAQILVRKDTPSAIVSTDGDNIARRGTNYGAAYSQIVTSAGAFVDTFGGGQQYADGAVRGTATGTMMIGDDGTNVQSVHVDTSGDLQIDVLTSALPTGASTSAKQDTGNTSVASIDTKTPALGQALAATSSPVVLTAAQVTTLTPPAAITGFALEATLVTRLTESDFDTKTGALTEVAPASDTASSGLNGRLQRIAQRITSLIALFPTSLGQKTMANSLAVVVASDQSTLPISNAKNFSSVATLTNVASSASSVQLVAANAARKGLLIYNDGTALLRIKFGTTASATSFSIPIATATLYTMDFPFFDGRIDGIWAAANGSARITELT